MKYALTAALCLCASIAVAETSPECELEFDDLQLIVQGYKVERKKFATLTGPDGTKSIFCNQHILSFPDTDSFDKLRELGITALFYTNSVSTGLTATTTGTAIVEIDQTKQHLHDLKMIWKDEVFYGHTTESFVEWAVSKIKED